MSEQTDEFILIVTDKGYAVKTAIDDYPPRHRGTKGVKAISITEEKGKPIFAKRVKDDEELMIVTRLGQGAKVPVSEIKASSRGTTGVKLVTLDAEDMVISIA